MFLVHEEREKGMGDWLVRGCVALPFLIFGLEKFGNDPHWTKMFREIGWGLWFRYFVSGNLHWIGIQENDGEDRTAKETRQEPYSSPVATSICGSRNSSYGKLRIQGRRDRMK
jgi:hypothetical protein